jgi:predicted nucleic acid-binding Zn ribbon protein
MTADPLSDCPECGGPVKRLVGAGAGLLFKGSGFYLTDYRSEAYKKQAKKESGTAGEKGGKEKKKGKKPEGKS